MNPLPQNPPQRWRAPLFPLPNVVLFPGAVLPLHIFEERYKVMTADVLAGEKRLAMALLKKGWELDYYAKPAIEPVVCLGVILSHEKLAEGNYNFLLQGWRRARVVRESPSSRPYRIAELEPLEETEPTEAELMPQRRRLESIFAGRVFSRTGLGRQFGRMLRMEMPTAEVADLIAFNLLEDVALKQSLLAEPDVPKRIDRLIAAMEMVAGLLNPVHDPSLN